MCTTHYSFEIVLKLFKYPNILGVNGWYEEAGHFTGASSEFPIRDDLPDSFWRMSFLVSRNLYVSPLSKPVESHFKGKVASHCAPMSGILPKRELMALTTWSV